VEKIVTFIRESYAELKRVTWPTRKEIGGSTLVVFIVVSLLMVLVALFDFVLALLVRLLMAR
jgi:preprotein translocase subunit SecE